MVGRVTEYSLNGMKLNQIMYYAKVVDKDLLVKLHDIDLTINYIVTQSYAVIIRFTIVKDNFIDVAGHIRIPLNWTEHSLEERESDIMELIDVSNDPINISVIGYSYDFRTEDWEHNIELEEDHTTIEGVASFLNRLIR